MQRCAFVAGIIICFSSWEFLCRANMEEDMSPWWFWTQKRLNSVELRTPSNSRKEKITCTHKHTHTRDCNTKRRTHTRATIINISHEYEHTRIHTNTQHTYATCLCVGAQCVVKKICVRPVREIESTTQADTEKIAIRRKCVWLDMFSYAWWCVYVCVCVSFVRKARLFATRNENGRVGGTCIQIRTCSYIHVYVVCVCVCAYGWWTVVVVVVENRSHWKYGAAPVVGVRLQQRRHSRPRRWRQQQSHIRLMCQPKLLQNIANDRMK